MINIYVRHLDVSTFQIIRFLRSTYSDTFKFWFSSVDFQDLRILRWKDKGNIETILKDATLLYFEWNISIPQFTQLYNGESYLYSLQSLVNDNILILDNQSISKNQYALIVDSQYNNSFPKVLLFPYITNSSDVCNYCKTTWNRTFNIFSLKDANRFQISEKLTRKEGTYVAQEKATGYYWYMDMLHKTHYEVFDVQGLHMSEANLEGEFIPNSKHKGRKIDL